MVKNYSRPTILYLQLRVGCSGRATPGRQDCHVSKPHNIKNLKWKWRLTQLLLYRTWKTMKITSSNSSRKMLTIQNPTTKTSASNKRKTKSLKKEKKKRKKIGHVSPPPRRAPVEGIFQGPSIRHFRPNAAGRGPWVAVRISRQKGNCSPESAVLQRASHCSHGSSIFLLLMYPCMNAPPLILSAFAHFVSLPSCMNLIPAPPLAVGITTSLLPMSTWSY